MAEEETPVPWMPVDMGTLAEEVMPVAPLVMVRRPEEAVGIEPEPVPAGMVPLPKKPWVLLSAAEAEA